MLSSCVSKSQKGVSLQCTENRVYRGRKKAEFSHFLFAFHPFPQEKDLKTTKKRMEIILREVKFRAGKMMAREAVVCVINKS